jgi:AmiR/NasT family two-component response regulator
MTADEAFDVLRRASQRSNRKLRDIAVELVSNQDRPRGLD